jgi:hypothetical protein
MTDVILHALRCMGFASLDRVAYVTGLPDAESHLLDLAVAGFVTYTPGDFGGWGLTEAGKTEIAERLAAELAETGARDTITKAYQDFLVLNPELLDLCAAWQSRGGSTPNDHTDPDYDARVLDRLTDLHERVTAVCGELSSALPRFERYRSRLTRALVRVRAGRLDYVTDAMESYHVIWFQLHEDLLVTLGIPR